MGGTIRERVCLVVEEQLGLTHVVARLDSTHIQGDLDADSLDLVEIVMALETEFEMEISGEDAEACKTLRQMVDLIERQEKEINRLMGGSGYNENGEWVTTVKTSTVPDEVPEKTGGSSANQYRVSLSLPTTGNRSEFVTVDLEFGDVSQAFSLTANEFNTCKGMMRKGKKEGTSEDYDQQKAVWFSLRSRLESGNITHKEFWQMAKVCALSEEI